MDPFVGFSQGSGQGPGQTQKRNDFGRSRWAPDTNPSSGFATYPQVIYDMGGSQKYGPLLGPLNTRCRTILRTRKETIVLTTTQIPNKSPYL